MLNKVKMFQEEGDFIAYIDASLSAFGETPEKALQELTVVVGMAIDTYKEEGWDYSRLQKHLRVIKYTIDAVNDDDVGLQTLAYLEQEHEEYERNK